MRTLLTLTVLFCTYLGIAEENTGNLKAQLKNGETIAFLGDSITAGGGNYGGYCRLVVQGLKTKGINAKAIYAGVPGNKSSDMLLRLDEILKRKPDHLFLSVGVNDVWHTDPTARIGVFKPSLGMGVELEHFKIYIPQILDRCKAAGTKVIMSTFTQITENPEHRLNKKALAYNKFLKGQANDRGLPIALLNENSWAKIAEIRAKGSDAKRNVISSDGIHPTSIGHRNMALGILKVMGFTSKELAKVDKEWQSCPRILIAGDQQVTSAGREGGWLPMLLDAINTGREMVLSQSVASRDSMPMKELAGMLKKAKLNPNIEMFVLVPPLKDVEQKTALEEYEDNLAEIVNWAKSKDFKICVSTLPLLNGKAYETVHTYNDLIRKVCRETETDLADLHKAMAEYQKKEPGSSLTISNGRLNYEGCKLMAEVTLSALGNDLSNFEELSSTWDVSPSYTFNYSSKTSFSINLSPKGEEALKAVSDRFHKLSAQKILDLGIHLILNDPAEQNLKRIRFADENWTAKEASKKALSLRKAPASASQLQKFQTYMEKEGIDAKTFYERAFLLGLFVMRNEDPLGRGKF